MAGASPSRASRTVVLWGLLMSSLLSLKLLQGLFQTLCGLVNFLHGDGERWHEADGIGPDHIEQHAGFIGVRHHAAGDIAVELHGCQEALATHCGHTRE